MGKFRFIFFTFVVLLLMVAGAKAHAQSEPDSSEWDIFSYVIFSEDYEKGNKNVDSLFYSRSLPIIFPVSKTVIEPNNANFLKFINEAVPLIKRRNINNATIRIRSAASPEGPLAFNKQLGKGRRDALINVFEQYGVKPSEMQIDVIDEDYELLAFNMRQAHDPDATYVSNIVRENQKAPARLKNLLQRHNGGKTWRRLLQEYFPALRASRFMIIFPDNTKEDVVAPEAVAARVTQPDVSMTTRIDSIAEVEEPLIEDSIFAIEPRREYLSVKTNMLMWGAYVPNYGWCPMPNVAVEYYPRHGHFTFGAMFDCPWWKGNNTSHKYFQARNYTLESRYYFRRGDEELRPAGMGAAFKGMYLSAYAHAAMYAIGWSDNKGFDGPGSIGGHGWEGEGIGAGMGIGYVMPLGKNEHWRLEFSAQFGYFRTQYDPYIYGCPVEQQNDGRYYYVWYRDASEFQKRQYRFNWIGPTRVSIQLSYDLLYRKKHTRGVGFKSWEKGGWYGK